MNIHDEAEQAYKNGYEAGVKACEAEIERLEEENKKVSAYIGNGWGYVSFLEFVKNQRAEAIKEFAERLRAVGNKRLWICAINETDIDTVANELTEGKE